MTLFIYDIGVKGQGKKLIYNTSIILTCSTYIPNIKGFKQKTKMLSPKTHAVRLELEELTNNMSPFNRTEDINLTSLDLKQVADPFWLLSSSISDILNTEK